MSLTVNSSLESARRKFFMKSTVNHVEKVGIKHSWAQVAEMSLKAMCWLKSARRKLFMNSTYIRCRK